MLVLREGCCSGSTTQRYESTEPEVLIPQDQGASHYGEASLPQTPKPITTAGKGRPCSCCAAVAARQGAEQDCVLGSLIR